MHRNFDDAYRQDGADGEHRAWTGPERRVQRTTNKELVAEIVCAIQETHKPLSDDERQWVRLAIQREAQSIKLRQAIIEKTLGGLVWAAVIGLGVLFLNYAKSHGIDLTK